MLTQARGEFVLRRQECLRDQPGLSEGLEPTNGKLTQPKLGPLVHTGTWSLHPVPVSSCCRPATGRRCISRSCSLFQIPKERPFWLVQLCPREWNPVKHGFWIVCPCGQWLRGIRNWTHSPKGAHYTPVHAHAHAHAHEIGRASCRERV